MHQFLSILLNTKVYMGTIAEVHWNGGAWTLNN